MDNKISLNDITIRRFKEQDAEAVQTLIVRNFLEVNSKDYGMEIMQEVAKTYDSEKIKRIASYAHMYVFEYHKQVVGVYASAFLL